MFVSPASFDGQVNEYHGTMEVYLYFEDVIEEEITNLLFSTLDYDHNKYQPTLTQMEECWICGGINSLCQIHGRRFKSDRLARTYSCIYGLNFQVETGLKELKHQNMEGLELNLHFCRNLFDVNSHGT